VDLTEDRRGSGDLGLGLVNEKVGETHAPSPSSWPFWHPADRHRLRERAGRIHFDYPLLHSGPPRSSANHQESYTDLLSCRALLACKKMIPGVSPVLSSTPKRHGMAEASTASQGLSEQALHLLSVLADPNLGIPVQPTITPDIAVMTLPDELGVQIRGLPEPLILRGRVCEAVVQYLFTALDGTRDLRDLLAERPPTIADHVVLRIVWLFHRKGVVVQASVNRDAKPDESERRQRLFWGRNLSVTRAHESADDVQAQLEAAHVVIVADGLFGAATIDVMQRSGIANLQAVLWDDNPKLFDGVVTSPGSLTVPGRMDIVGLSEALEPLLADADLLMSATVNASAKLDIALNNIALDKRVPYLRGALVEDRLDIGPLVLPYESACMECMLAREASVQETPIEEELYQRWRAVPRGARPVPPVGEPLYAAAAGAGLMTGEAIRTLTSLQPVAVVNAVRTMFIATGETTVNRFLRVPRCPRCYRPTTIASY
jgi:bacteriocin biosynthesis cyclodehydratase domain-containing protein